MTRLVLLALALVAIVSLAAARVPAKRVAEFQDWKAKYGKSYKTPTEEASRLSIFHDNLNFIESHVAEAKGYTVGTRPPPQVLSLFRLRAVPPSSPRSPWLVRSFLLAIFRHEPVR